LYSGMRDSTIIASRKAKKSIRKVRLETASLHTSLQ
jgi:hypothetical protein